MKIKISNIHLLIYGFLWFDILCFIIGYLKPIFAVCAVAALCIMMFFTWKTERENTEELEFSKGFLIASGAIILFYMLLTGQMGWVSQSMDWLVRNAILHDMTSSKWPVYYDNGSAFTYYLAMFLPPAVIGKIFGLGGAYVGLWIWSSFGVWLIYLLLIKIVKADTMPKKVIAMAMLLFFSDAQAMGDIIGNLIQGIVCFFSKEYQYVSFPYGMTANYNAFSWVFNQIIPIFMAIVVYFSSNKDRKNIMVMGSVLLLHSPFPLIPFFFIVAVDLIADIINQKSTKPVFECITLQNLIALLVFVPIFVLYIAGNVFAEKPASLRFSADKSVNLLTYLIFVLIAYGVYAVLVWKENRKNISFISSSILIALFPFFKMGLYNDLRTRGTSVCLFIVMICIMKLWFNQNNKNNRKRCIVLACVAIFSSIPTINAAYGKTIELAGNISDGINQNLTTCGTFNNISERYQYDDILYNFFTYDAENDFFYKYLAKPNKNNRED